MESVDLVVIGAGWNGLAIAKTYTEVHRTAKLVVLESAETVGGVWAQNRLYPGLRTNNIAGTYEYSDFPMDEATFGVKAGESIPGSVVHEYLRKYAEHFDVFRRIRFGVMVETVEKVDVDDSGSDVGWKLTTKTTKGIGATTESELKIIFSKKLVVATGLTSTPNVLSIPGSDSFDAPIFHTRDFHQNSSTLKTAARVSVMGGSKSAWDMAYEHASCSIPVDMIIGSSGHGPIWMSPPNVSPLKRWLGDLVHTRLLTWFSPCVWGEAHGFGGLVRHFLHGSSVGRRIVRTFWGMLGDDILKLNDYDKHPETVKLKPWKDPFLIGANGVAILHYPVDFFEFVRNGMIKVHQADIKQLSPHTVHLDTGVDLYSDALVCASGWKCKPALKFLPESLELSLGFPSDVDEDPIATQKADAEILRRFPSLMTHKAPNTGGWLSTTDRMNYHKAPRTPYRLYRFMVPPALIADRSIAFMGAMITISTPLIAQAQALWITAYFSSSAAKTYGKNNSLSEDNNEGDFLMPSVERAKQETILHTEFCKLRYPQGFGARFPDFAFDAVSYLDLLLGDLGLKGKRKPWWRDWWEAYGARDYKGLVGEWMVRKNV